MTQVVNFTSGLNNACLPVNNISQPLSGEDLAENFGSFQYFTDENGNSEKLSQEEFQRLEYFQRVLANEELNEYNYRREFEKVGDQLNRIMNSTYPLNIKTRMAQSIRDSLQSKLNCLRETNKTTREMIIEIEKMNNYSTYLNLIQRWKESHKFSKSHSTASTDMASYVSASPSQHNRNSIISKRTHSIISNQTLMDDAPEEYRRVDEMTQENFRLEDVIASLKETRNFLIMTIENSKDDMTEYQEFVQNKNCILKGKLQTIEQLKSKISAQSVKRSGNKLFSTYKSGSETERNEKSMSRVNTTVFQEVSSKVSSLFGKVFGGKSKQVNTDKVLSTEFLGELNLQTAPNEYTSPKGSGNYRFTHEIPSSTKSSKR